MHAAIKAKHFLKRLLPLASLLCLLALAALPAQRTDRVAAAFQAAPEGELLLVRFRQDTAQRQVEEVLARHALQVQRRLAQIEVWVLASPGKDAATAVQQMQGEPGVLWAESNGVFYASSGWKSSQAAAGITPDDNFYAAQQAHLRLIGLPEAWLFSTGNASPIAVVDTGIDLDHPDLAYKAWNNPGETANGLDDDGNGYVDDLQGWDFVQEDASPQDDNWHGSHVAGSAAAHSNNHIGIAGVAWQNPVMALKALNNLGEGSWADTAEAILYAADQGAKVINLSLGGAEYSETIAAAVSYAQSLGCLLIAATGNGGTAVHYPAALPGVLGVSASDENDLPWSLNNRGPEVDLAAPGVDIFSTNQNGSYLVATGTSMATAHVSGLAALLWSLQPGWSAEQVSQALIDSAKDIWSGGWDAMSGWGRIDARRAALLAVQPQVELRADRSVLHRPDEQAVLSAVVRDGLGNPVPDGLSLIFRTTLGELAATSGLSTGGVISTTFESRQTGTATITARLSEEFQDEVLVEVVRRVYLPVFYPQQIP